MFKRIPHHKPRTRIATKEHGATILLSFPKARVIISSILFSYKSGFCCLIVNFIILQTLNLLYHSIYFNGMFFWIILISWFFFNNVGDIVLVATNSKFLISLKKLTITYNVITKNFNITYKYRFINKFRITYISLN